MNKRITTQQIVGTGLLLALEIVLQVIGNYLQFGPVNINISLVAIVLAAVLYGPFSGAVLGFFNGIITLFSPSTIGLFMQYSPVGTVIACLLKCTIAGFVAGLVFKLFKTKKVAGLVTSSVLVPVINTGIFSVVCFIFFQDMLRDLAQSSAAGEVFKYFIVGFIGWNFLVELIATVVLSTILGMVLLKRKVAE